MYANNFVVLVLKVLEQSSNTDVFICHLYRREEEEDQQRDIRVMWVHGRDVIPSGRSWNGTRGATISLRLEKAIDVGRKMKFRV